MKKIVVTGGSGFVGLNIANFLVARGYQVIALDIVRNKLLDPKVKFYRIDIRNHRLGHYLEGVDTIFHTAALIKFQESINDPSKYHDVNVNGTLNLLMQSLKVGVRKIVYSSSSSIYGPGARVPQTEDMFPDPRSPYAAQKLLGEIYMQTWSNCYDIKTVSLRYFNFYGPHNINSSGVIDIYLDHHQKNKPLIIYGNGQQKRSFLYIDDLVRANVLAMKSKKVGRGEVINIGLDKAYSINQVAKIFGGKMVHQAKIKKNEDFQPYESLPNIKKGQELLNWRPEIYLEEGIELMEKANHNDEK